MSDSNIHLGPHKVGMGHYSCVFPYDGKVIKVFKKGEKKKNTEFIFNDQAEAYELASNNAVLSKYVPEFHGKKIIDSVKIGTDDVSDQYHLDMAFCMDKVEGFASSKYCEKDLKKISDIFKSVGILGLDDVDCFLLDERIRTIIDFSLHKYEVWDGNILVVDGPDGQVTI